MGLIYLLGALLKSYGAPRKLPFLLKPNSTSMFPISLKYAPGEAWLGSSHSTRAGSPNPGTLVVTPGGVSVLRVVALYTNLILSTCCRYNKEISVEPRVGRPNYLERWNIPNSQWRLALKVLDSTKYWKSHLSFFHIHSAPPETLTTWHQVGFLHLQELERQNNSTPREVTWILQDKAAGQEDACIIYFQRNTFFMFNNDVMFW